MPRGRVALLASLALLLGPGRGVGAEVPLPALAYAVDGDIWVADADGSNTRRLTRSGRDSSLAWSPDGQRLAFVSGRDALVDQRRELYVVNADGSGLRRLSDDRLHPVDANRLPAWSPDGSRIAVVRYDRDTLVADLWVVAADGSSSRRLTHDRQGHADPQWATGDEILDSTTVVGSSNPSDSAIRRVNVETGASRVIAHGAFVALSPDRTKLAYVPAGTSGFVVADAAGKAPQPLRLPGPVLDQLEWSPDGTRIAFNAYVPKAVDQRGSSRSTRHLWLLDVRTGATRRLTGYPGDPTVHNEEAPQPPISWLGGERLVFRDGSGRLRVIESDGDCEQAHTLRAFHGVAWRPGSSPPTPPLTCVDLWTRGTNTHKVARGQPINVAVTVRNVGNIAASQTRVAALPVQDSGRIGSVTTSQGSCDAVRIQSSGCDLGAIPPGALARLTLTLLPTRTGYVKIKVGARSVAEPDVREWNDSYYAVGFVSPCSILGTARNDVLLGTRSADHICGRAGADRISGNRGNDRIEAGQGEDTVMGGDGRDVIVVRDGARDTVSCGSGRDTVHADRKDSVARDCEQVLRR